MIERTHCVEGPENVKLKEHAVELLVSPAGALDISGTIIQCKPNWVSREGGAAAGSSAVVGAGEARVSHDDVSLGSGGSAYSAPVSASASTSRRSGGESPLRWVLARPATSGWHIFREASRSSPSGAPVKTPLSIRRRALSWDKYMCPQSQSREESQLLGQDCQYVLSSVPRSQRKTTNRARLRCSTKPPRPPYLIVDYPISLSTSLSLCRLPYLFVYPGSLPVQVESLTITVGPGRGISVFSVVCLLPWCVSSSSFCFVPPR
jgi:hypothetical protein